MRGQGGSADLPQQECHTRDGEGQIGPSVIADDGAVCFA